MVLPVTPDVDNIFYKFERCMVFRFRVNNGHTADGRTDRQTDGQSVTHNAAS